MALLLALVAPEAKAQATNATAGVFQFVSEKMSVAEGESKPNGYSIPGALITVIRTGGLTGHILVDIATVSGTNTNTSAKPTVDFVPFTNTLEFSEFQSSTYVYVPIIDNKDTNNANDLSFNVVLSNVRPAEDEDPTLVATLGKTTNMTVTISDNDYSFNMERARSQFLESSGNATVKVLFAMGAGEGFSVDYRIVPTTDLTPNSERAQEGIDYEAVSGTLAFEVGQTEGTIQIPLLVNTNWTFNRDFTVELLNAKASQTMIVTNTVMTTNDTGEVTTEVTEEEVKLEMPIGKVTSTVVTILNDVKPTPAGAVDPEYNPAWNEYTEPAYNPFPGVNNTVNGIAMQPDGKAILVGEFSSANAFSSPRVARYDTNGAVDRQFVVGTGADGSVLAAKVGANGNVYIGGAFNSFNGAVRKNLARLKSDGSLDSGFNTGTSIDGVVRALELNNNQDRLIIAGDFRIVQGLNRNGIAILNENGGVDQTFDPGLGANGPIYALARQADGRILVGGDFTALGGEPRNCIARLNTDGTLDNTFNPSGGADGPVYAIAVRSAVRTDISAQTTETAGAYTNTFNVSANEGNIQLHYVFEGNNSNDTSNTVKVVYGTNTLLYTNIVVGISNNAVGTINLAFGPGETTDVTIIVNENDRSNQGAWSYTGTVVSSGAEVGKILIGGAFTTFDLISRNGVAQLNTDGTLDTAYDLGTGFDGPVYSLQLSENGKLYAGGAFTTVNGTLRRGIARVLNDGLLDTSFMDPTYNQYAGLPVYTSWDSTPFVNSMALAPGNRLLIGGYFEGVGGCHATDTYHEESILREVTDLPAFYPTRDFAVYRANFTALAAGETPGPGNIMFERAQYAVDENAGNGKAVVIRTNGVLGSITLHLETKDGTALAGEDYEAYDAMTTQWGNNDDRRWVMGVVIYNDGKAEGDQNFQMLAVKAESSFFVGGVPIPMLPAIGRGVATITIIDGAVAPTFFDFSAPEFGCDENSGNAVVTVARTGNINGRVTVDYKTAVMTNLAAGTFAQPGLNYQSRQGTLIFESSQTNKTISIPLIDNLNVEPDKSFAVRLSNPKGNGARLGQVTNSMVSIVDNDYAAGKLTFVSTNYTAVENSQFATIAVKRKGGNLGVVSVDYSTEDSTAISGVDYLYTFGRLEWNSGDSAEKTFTIPLVDDNLTSTNKVVKLTLSNFVNAIPGQWTNATLSISDDDSFGRLSFAAQQYAVGENEGLVILTVKRLSGTAGDITFSYKTQNGTAKAGIDYTGSTNTVNMVSGQISTNITVQVFSDLAASTNKTFVVALYDAINASLGTASNATVTIIDRQSYNQPPGQLDTTFANAVGADNTVYALGVQTDGKVVAAGDFAAFNQVSRARVARLQMDGSLDSTFDPAEGPNDSVRAMLAQEDGKILLGGLFTTYRGINRNYIARVNTDGTLDSLFTPGAGADNPVYGLVQQPDGRIMVGGDFASFNGINRGRIARLLSNGKVDTSFDPGAGLNGPVYAVALQADGKIIVGGRFTTANNVPQTSLARLNADGSVDSSFFVGLGPDAPVRALAVQPDGQILVGGQFTSFNGYPAGRIVRLSIDGAMDPTFNPGTGADDAVYAITLQNDGKVLLGGDFTRFNGVTRSRVTRLNADGSVDPTINFGTGANAFVSSIVVQTDRKIVLGGGFTQFNNEPKKCIARIHGGSVNDAGSFEFSVARYSVSEKITNAVVKVNRSGGTTGSVTVDFATADATAQAGVDYLGFSRSLTFAEGETVQTILVPIIDDTTPEDDEAVNLVLSNPTGGAVLGSQPTAQISIVSDDTGLGFSSASFSVNENVGSGQATITVVRTGGSNTEVSVSYSTSDGTAVSNVDYRSTSGTLVFLAGETVKTFPVVIIDDATVQNNHTVNLTLYNATGSAVLSQSTATLTIVDNDFAAGSLRFSSASYQVNEQGTNAVVTVQRVNGFTGVISVNFATSDGTAKAGVKYVAASQTLAFADGETTKTILIGIINNELVEGDQSINLTLTKPTGGAALGSPSTASIYIADDDFGPGSIDNTFSIGSGANGAVRAIEQQYDGQIVIAGSFTTFNGQSRSRVARLGTNGAVDMAFAPVIDGRVSTINTLKDGRVVIGGEFRNVNNASRSWAARLNSSGQSDPAFFGVSGVNGPVLAMFTQPDNRVVVGGDFVMPTADCLRLNDNGSLDITFNPDGGTDGAVYAIARQADGSYIIGGQFTKVGGITRGSLARVNAVGLLDTTFASGNGVNGTVYAVAVQADGKVIIGGNFTQVNGVSCNNLARLNPDGAVDLAFAANVSVDGPVYALCAQNDGRFFVGGQFSTINGESRACLARLNRDGMVDNIFMPGSGANGTVYAISMQMDGKVLVAGNFSLMNGAQLNGVARLLGDDGSKGLVGVTSPAKGQINLALAVQLGGVYQLQSSGDLTNWTSIGTNYLATNSPMLFAETVAATNTFFRAVRHDGYRLSTENMTNGNLVTFSVLAGKPYIIQASDNEVDWAVLGTNSSVTTTLKHLDRTAVGITNRLYRAVQFEQP